MTTAPFGSEICPRCETGILIATTTSQDINVAGSMIRVPNVKMEECHYCGFLSLSGKDVGLFDLLFAPQYERVGELVSALKAAGYTEMFLKDDRPQSDLNFGSREYVSGLSDDLKGLYLDNESHHLIEGLSHVASGNALIELPKWRCTVKLPRLGEGENGLVYEYKEDREAVLKIAKPRAYSRDHVKAETELTSVFESKGIPVPRILETDPHGSFIIKEKIEGESLARVYDTLGPPDSPYHQRVRAAVEAFVERLMKLFKEHPETMTSISPNNIYVITSGNDCRCVLVDTGPAPFHDYSNFVFSNYWLDVIPQKIRQYRAVGYL